MRWPPLFTSARETSPVIFSLTWSPSPYLQVCIASPHTHTHTHTHIYTRVCVCNFRRTCIFTVVPCGLPCVWYNTCLLYLWWRKLHVDMFGQNATVVSQLPKDSGYFTDWLLLSLNADRRRTSLFAAVLYLDFLSISVLKTVFTQCCFCGNLKRGMFVVVPSAACNRVKDFCCAQRSEQCRPWPRATIESHVVWFHKVKASIYCSKRMSRCVHGELRV